jgi:fibronectin type 3 domain-containing protein
MRPIPHLAQILAFALVLLAAKTCPAGGWYVGNTATGEWIQHTNVWLSAGNYRFTANAGSPAAGAVFHLEIDGVTIRPAVAVPNTGRADSFAYVHLGSAAVSEGYHNLRVVFETAGVSLDWIMLRKDSDTTTSVKASDVTLVRPSTKGMLIAPIVSFNAQSDANSRFNANDASSFFGAYPQKDANGQPYTDTQLRSWYSAPMFQDFDRRTDRYWDIMVDQLIASRAQVPLIHCRSTADFTHDLQDRAYVQGNGSFEGRWLKKFVEAIGRNPQAASGVQIGMFFEDGPLADDYFTRFGSYPSWGLDALADYVMQYWLSPWFDNVPTGLLYQPSPSRVIINIWTASPTDMVQDGNLSVFMTNIRSRMIAKYGLNPLFIVPPNADANAQAAAWGVAPWYSWGGTLYTSNVSPDGTRWGFSSCGSRKRIDTVWANDWDPVTNTGTAAGSDAGDPDYQSPLDANGNSTLLNFYAQASAAGTRLIQEEGFYNIPEGSPIFASSASGWNFPNQHLAAMRQYADPSTDSLMFESESCDSYSKASVHENLGGSYRRQWYSTTGLDVYRPLHNLAAWANKSTGPGTLTELSAGFFDVWALDSSGKVWAHSISDGAPNTWTSVSLNGISKFTSLSVGKHHAWAVNGTSVYSCKLGYSSSTQSHGTWTLQSGSMVQVAVNAADVWALDAAGAIYKRRVNELDYPGGVWTQVPGPVLSRISTGGNFVWGINGTNIYFSQTTNGTWQQVPNPNNITKISVGSEEVWGINAAGNVFRMSAAGVGGWDPVDGNLTKIAVGENYAWGLSGTTPSSRRLTGFQGSAVATTPPVPSAVTAKPGNAQVLLSWIATPGATSYNIRRSTTSGGPYTTIATGVYLAPSYADTGLVNGTTYYYVVSAANGVGETPAPEVNAVPATAGVPPSPPASLAATGGVHQVSLSWPASTDATSYSVKRADQFSGGPYTTIATGVTATSYIDTGLMGDRTYYYVVSASNAVGESFTNSPEASAKPSDTPLSRSGWTTSASIGGSTGNAIDGNITTRWATGGPQVAGQWFQVNMGAQRTFSKITLDQGTSTNDYPRGYQVNVSSDGTNWGDPVATGGGSSPVTIITFPDRTARYIRITQTGSASNYWSIHELNVYLALTAPPSALSATVLSSSQIALSWPASAGATSYNVKRALVSGGPYTSIASGVTATGYTDSGLAGTTTYYYVVSSVSGGGESTASSQVAATTLTSPAAPGSFTATPRSESQLQLAWINNATDATSITVQSSPRGAGTWSTLASNLSPTTTSFMAEGLTASTAYDFRVQCVSPGGTSAFATLSATTPAGINDGIPGAWRLLYFGNGLTLTADSGLHADPDGDTMDNLAEYLSGTSPVDAGSALRITDLSASGQDIRISFPSVTGKNYQVEKSDSLESGGSWTVVQDSIPGINGTITVTDSGALAQPKRFYRVRLK